MSLLKKNLMSILTYLVMIGIVNAVAWALKRPAGDLVGWFTLGLVCSVWMDQLMEERN